MAGARNPPLLPIRSGTPATTTVRREPATTSIRREPATTSVRGEPGTTTVRPDQADVRRQSRISLHPDRKQPRLTSPQRAMQDSGPIGFEAHGPKASGARAGSNSFG
jgi:hypothetical protein